MKLDKLLKDIRTVSTKNYKNIDVKDISYSSLACTRDSLFVAIEGYSKDGHAYIDDAISKGASVIVHTKEIAYLDDIVYIKVTDIRNVLARLSSRFYNFPSEKLHVIAITGTNGKTTFCSMANCIFASANKKTAMSTTVGSYINDIFIPAKTTTPESTDLQFLMQTTLKKGYDYFFMEASSQGLIQQRMRYTKLDCAVFSNLTHDHLDFHGNMENYYQAKKLLFLSNPTYSVINIDDPYGKRLANELKENGQTEVITFSFHQNSDYKITDFKQNNWQQTFCLQSDTFRQSFTINVAGKHNAYNAVPAIIYALKKVLPLKTIRTALKKYEPIDGRLTTMKHNDFNIIIDFAHTPDGLQNLLDAVRANTKNKVITVFSCNGNRDKEKRPIMGRIAYENSDYVIMTQGSPRCEKDADIFNDIKKGFPPDADVLTILPRSQAITHALSLAKKGDSVVISGMGHYKYMEIDKKRIPYNDEQTVRKYLSMTEKEDKY